MLGDSTGLGEQQGYRLPHNENMFYLWRIRDFFTGRG